MTYKSIDIAYRLEYQKLLSAARSRLKNQDYAIDCVHEAFEKVIVYMKTHKTKKVSGFLLLRAVTRAVTRYNKQMEHLSFNDGIDTTDSDSTE